VSPAVGKGEKEGVKEITKKGCCFLIREFLKVRKYGDKKTEQIGGEIL